MAALKFKLPNAVMTELSRVSGLPMLSVITINQAGVSVKCTDAIADATATETAAAATDDAEKSVSTPLIVIGCLFLAVFIFAALPSACMYAYYNMFDSDLSDADRREQDPNAWLRWPSREEVQPSRWWQIPWLRRRRSNTRAAA